MRLTVGPLPPAVYWRRRALVLAVALALLFALFQACGGSDTPGEASGGESPAPGTGGELLTPTTGRPEDRPDGEEGDDEAEPAADADAAAAAEPCTDDDMLITAEAAATELTAGQRVRFTMWIRNDSDRTCQRDVGGDERELFLRPDSGAGPVWSTRACGGPTGSDLKDLEPGFESEHFIDWNGRSSRTCADDGTPQGPQLEPGEYELVARLGTDHSEPVPIVVR